MIYDLVAAVRDTLAEADGVEQALGNETVKDGMNDWPTVVVLPAMGTTDVTSRTDRSTFGAGLRQKQVVLHVRVFVRQRSLIGEEMAAIAEVADAVEAILDAQREPPFFGSSAILTFRWTWERVVFEYGDQQTPYAGLQFVLTCTVKGASS